MHLILSDHADVSFGLKSEARKFQLDYIPIVTERFDLIVYRKYWFENSFQTLLNFCKTQEFLKLALAHPLFQLKVLHVLEKFLVFL